MDKLFIVNTTKQYPDCTNYFAMPFLTYVEAVNFVDRQKILFEDKDVKLHTFISEFDFKNGQFEVDLPF